VNPQYGGKLRELKRRIGRGSDFGNTWSLAAQLQWVGFSREERSFDSAFAQDDNPELISKVTIATSVS